MKTWSIPVTMSNSKLFIYLQHNDRDVDVNFGDYVDDEMCIIAIAYYVINDHSNLQLTLHMNSWGDMFSNVPEIEANTLNGTYYEPCTDC